MAYRSRLAKYFFMEPRKKIDDGPKKNNRKYLPILFLPTTAFYWCKNLLERREGVRKRKQ